MLVDQVGLFSKNPEVLHGLHHQSPGCSNWDWGVKRWELRYGVRQTFGLQTPLRVLVDVRNIWLYINVYLSASVIIENNRKLVFFKRIFAQFSFTPNIEGSYYLVLPPVLMSTLGVHLFLKISPHDLSTCFPSVRWYGFSTGKTTPDSSLLSWVPLPAPYCIYMGV